jgi:deoxyribonuclease I
MITPLFRSALVLAVFSIALTAQAELLKSQSSLNFGSVSVGQTASQAVSILWDDDAPMQVDIEDPSGKFSVTPSTLDLLPGQWYTISVEITPTQNSTYAGSLIVSGAQDALSISLSATGDLPGSTWDSTFDLDGEALKSQLSTLVSGHSVYSYDSARNHMYSDYDNQNGWIEGVYTGYMVQTWGIPDHTVVNTEHTWPQSMGADGDARSDMQHLFPCKSTVNTSRGNLPFGEVVTSSSGYPIGGADRGTNAQGITVFEPRAEHKGDCARSMFYFLIRYGNRFDFMNQANQELVLRNWSSNDLPGTWEDNRQDAIGGLQNRRNPFVDHPAFMDRMASLTSGADLVYEADAAVFPSALDLGEQSYDAPESGHVVLTNPGDATLLVNAVSLYPLCFSVDSAPTQLAPGESHVFEITPVTSCGMNPTAIFEIQTSEGNFSIPLSANLLQGAIPSVDVDLSYHDGQLVFNWSPVSGATWYRLEFSQNQDGPWIPLITGPSTILVLPSAGYPAPSLFRVIAGN